jgi:hypothetical protein
VLFDDLDPGATSISRVSAKVLVAPDWWAFPSHDDGFHYSIEHRDSFTLAAVTMNDNGTPRPSTSR